MGKSDQQGAANPFQSAPPAKKILTLAGVYMALVGSIIQSTGLSVMLPVAAVELGGIEYYSLASTLTGITSVAAMPLWGYLGARNPAIKRPIFSITLLIGAVVVFARVLAPNMLVLVVPSVLYGFVSASIFVLGFSIIRDMYEGKQAGVYLGFCGTMMALGALAGPALAGIVSDLAGWRWICHVIWPLLLAAALFVWFGVKATKSEAECLARKGGKFDLAGTIAIVVLLATFVLGLSLGTSFVPFGSLGSYALFALALVSLLALVCIIRKKKSDAAIPLPALKNRNIICFSAANFFTNFSNMALSFFLPLYVLNVMALSATEAALTTTVMSIIGLVLSPILGKAIGKTGNARGILASSIVLRIAVALALLMVLSPNGNIWVVYVIMFAAGYYRCAQSTVFSAGPQIQLPAELRVQGNSVIQVGQNLGGAIGVSVYTLLIGMCGVADGMSASLIISILTAAVGLAFALGLKKQEKDA